MILDTDVAELSSSYSFELRDFLRSCLNRDPLKRVPADLLLTAPFLTKYKAISYESSVKIVKGWIRSL
jgi:serine/threonine protein kinase